MRIGEFARLLGVSRTRYWQYKWEGMMTDENMEQAAANLGVPVAALKGRADRPETYGEPIPELPIPIPIIAEGSAGEGDGFLEFSYWAPARVANRSIKGYRVNGDCLEPALMPGDTVFVDRDLSPRNGDIVLCFMDGRNVFKRYREADGNKWLENRHGKVGFDDCELRGVVFERTEKMR
jgi:hypothetical protein